MDLHYNESHYSAYLHGLKIMTVMTLTVALSIMTLLQASAAAWAQNVSLKANSATLEEIFSSLHKQTGYNFVYNSSVLESSTPVTIDVEDKPLTEVLDLCFLNQPLTYVIEDETVVVKQKNESPKRKTAIILNGTVMDRDGVAMPGTTVKIKGSEVGTITDANGGFQLQLETGNETLIISFIGFKTMEVSVGGRTSITITLEEDISSLNEIVVIGYGTVKKRDLTGAVSSVKGTDVAMNPVSNVMEALQGRVPGLDIQRTDGRAGASPTVLLRGNRSINAKQDPLYVIDGIQGSITSLNPNDIESIDVLRDASSTAIYGSAGSNGVVIITTKKAKSGKVEIDVDSYYGVNGFAAFPKPLTKDAWLRYHYDRYAASNGGIPPADINDFNFSSSVKPAIDAGQWVDWVDETLQNGIQQNHHISVRGGSEKAQAYFSLGYIGEKGIYKGDEATFYNVRGGADVKFNDLFKAGIQTTVNLKDNDKTNSRVNKAYSIYPLGTPYNEDGTVNLYPLGDAATVSPIANYASGVFVNNSKNLYMAINPYLEFTPFKNFSLRSNLGLTFSVTRDGLFENERSYNSVTASLNTKRASYETGLSYGFVWENIANYSFTAKDHSVTITGITSVINSKSEASSIAGQGMDYDEFLYFNLGAAPVTNGKTTSLTILDKLSFTGRVNYTYRDKYLLTLSNRYDGASQLERKWSAFPSAAVGWIISQENFMSNFDPWLNTLKLRAGYGVAGNANIPAYVSTTEVASRTSELNMSLGGTAAVPVYVLKQALGNADLTWEKSYNTNLGLDISIFNDRIDLSADAYSTHTKGVLYPRIIPSSAGGYDAKTAYTKTSNIAETENKGIELALSSRNIIRNNFQWRSTLTFTNAREKLTSIDLGNSVSATALISANLFVGQPLKTIYGYRKTGIWQLGEEDEAIAYGAKPGDIKLQTVPQTDAATGESDNGVHAYSPKDQMIVGHANPTWTLGFQNMITYKNFDLTVFVTMRYGHTINAQLLGYYNTIAQPATYNYWTPTNPTNDFPQPYQGSTINNTYASALSLVDGSYMKVKNLTLGYTVPEKTGSRLRISRLRVYGTAYNPFIFARNSILKNVDPETGGTDSFPLYKQVIFGINLSF